MTTRHLAIDIGAASGRVFVGEIENGILHSREIHRFVTHDVFFVNRRVRNFYRYYEEILHAIRKYSSEYGDTLGSIGADGFGSDFILLDRAGNPSMLTPSYRQNALESMEDTIDSIFGSVALYRRNGNHSMLSDTLQQLLRMRKERDPALDNPSAILFFADIFHYLLGAPACCEHSLASYSRFYDNRNQCWDDEVIGAFGLPETLKTKVTYCGDRIGTMHDELARDTGLKPGTPIVTPCSHDTACAALSIPDEKDDWLFISSGSWSLLGTETSTPILTEEAWRCNMSNSSMPFKVNMLKKNITGMWLMQECQRSWGKYSFDEMVDMAASEPNVDLYIDVNDRRFYAPLDMPTAVCDAVNSRYGTNMCFCDVGRILLICLQSIAMKYRFFLEKTIKVTGKTITKIYIIGGGGKNSLLNTLTANITGLPVITGVNEASVAGNLLLQAYGLGLTGSRAEIRRIVASTFPMSTTEPTDTKYWDGKYRDYCREFAERSFF